MNVNFKGWFCSIIVIKLLICMGLYERYQSLFVRHTVYVTGSDIMMCCHFHRLFESEETYLLNMEDIANILSQLDID